MAGDKCFQKVEQFKYLETTWENQNYVNEENKRKFKSGNDWYHAMQNDFSLSLLSKN